MYEGSVEPEYSPSDVQASAIADRSHCNSLHSSSSCTEPRSYSRYTGGDTKCVIFNHTQR